MSNNITMDFKSDWQQQMTDELTVLGYNVPQTTDYDKISLQYQNLKLRKLHSRARTLHEAQNFTCPSNHLTAYTQLKNIVTTGSDLNPSLSTRLTDLNFNDALLNDWGVYHFHLGILPHPNKAGFKSRTGNILMARVTDTDFYVIGLYNHNDFSNSDIIEAIHQNWPSSIQAFKIEGVTGERLSDDDIKALRNNNCNVMLGMNDGTTYAPLGGGVATSGINIQIRRAVDMMTREIETIESNLKSAVHEVLPQLDINSGTAVTFKFIVARNGRFIGNDINNKTFDSQTLLK